MSTIYEKLDNIAQDVLKECAEKYGNESKHAGALGRIEGYFLRALYAMPENEAHKILDEIKKENEKIA